MSGSGGSGLCSSWKTDRKDGSRHFKRREKASEMNYETISEPGLYINTKAAEDLGVTVDETLLESVAETFDSISK